MNEASVSNQQALRKATEKENFVDILEKLSKIDNTCSFTKCKSRTKDFGVQCKYCNLNFCLSHGLPEVHGCGEAVKMDEKRKFLHPNTKLCKQKHSQVHAKLNLKLKNMQLERKPKDVKKK